MIESLSQFQAQKLALHSQRLLTQPTATSPIDATLEAIEHLGYIQIDTISVIERAHHHTLWNRDRRCDPENLAKLVAQKKVFEYWSHAASFLPMRDYRFTLIRKNAFKSGAQKHWYAKDEKMLRHVQQRIHSEGPLASKDFSSSRTKRKEWQSKPAKQALEYLFMQGDLMVSSRHNFQKIYDLTERVLPTTVITTPPTQQEYARFLIRSFLRANGLALVEECGYLRQRVKPLLKTALQEMLHSNEVIMVRFDKNNYYALPESLPLLNKPLSRKKLIILSPFDNLVIQRKRLKNIFNFSYQIECYVPKNKRIYGYFSLPILWQGRLAARIDMKAERDTETLQVLSLHKEKWVEDIAAFNQALENELQHFMKFNSCKTIARLDR